MLSSHLLLFKHSGSGCLNTPSDSKHPGGGGGLPMKIDGGVRMLRVPNFLKIILLGALIYKKIILLGALFL